uniref:Non-specific serine/threonine protein kinase n=1 Tax=Steinernema glaseri TaxID=37863 RepID=A0A1I7YJF9_9BILA
MRTALSPAVLAADDDDPRNRSFSLGSRKHFWTQPLRKISNHLKGQTQSRQNSSFSSIASGHGDSSGACSMTSSNSALHPPKTTLFGGRRKTASGTSQHADIAEGGSVNSSQASLHSHRTGGSANSSRSLFRSKRAGSATDKGDMVEMEFPYEKQPEPTLRRVSRHGSESIEEMSSPSRSRTSSFGQGPPHSHSYHHHIGAAHRLFDPTAHGECTDFTAEQLHYLQRMRQSADSCTDEDVRKLQEKLQPVESFIRDDDDVDCSAVRKAAAPRVDAPSKTVVGPTSPGSSSFCSSPHLLMPHCGTYARFGSCCGGGVHFFETIQEAVSGRSSRCDSRCASSLADRSNALSPPCPVNASPSIVLVDESARRGSAASSSRPATSLLEDSRKSSCSSTASCCRRRSTTSVGAVQRRRSSAFEFYATHCNRKRTSLVSTASFLLLHDQLLPPPKHHQRWRRAAAS